MPRSTGSSWDSVPLKSNKIARALPIRAGSLLSTLDVAARVQSRARSRLPARVLESPSRPGAGSRERNGGGARRRGGRLRAGDGPDLRRGVGGVAVHRRDLDAAARLLRAPRDG